jgi:hypothetical protein
MPEGPTTMRLFSCQSCHQILFFESVQCTKCGHVLAYLPDRAVVGALEPLEAPAAADIFDARATWRVVGEDAGAAAAYRLCRNYGDHAVCNWAIPAGDPHDYCRACRLDHVIPDLGAPGAKEAWHRLEIAKRRVLYTLFALGLPVEGTDVRPQGGLAFDFLKEQDGPGAPRVFTGHDEGLITINIAEADAPFRERMRVQMGEAYRTVLGHFRHEIGHYYWDRLIRDGAHLAGFRARFGDERADYAAAQEHHYASGAPADWPSHFVSSYAAMHPWEDWAETWAHYLHMVDTLETARGYGLSLQAAAGGDTASPVALAARRVDPHAFDDMMSAWVPLTMALNSLNRSMGTSDAYPFVLSPPAVDKLRFVHAIVEDAAAGGIGLAPPSSLAA